MLTRRFASTSTTPTGVRGPGDEPSTATQRVVIVNGSGNMLELLETVLDASRYDVVFVESHAGAYPQIKRVRPHVVILCISLDDMDGFQLLSMLKLDEQTRHIPVLTYTTESEGDEASAEEASDTPGEEAFAPRPVPRMN